MQRLPNPQQQNVIDDLDNNLILFASAGTGKTFTVANRVANILFKEKATAKEILCLTFTIKASKEMQEDILNYAGEEAREVSVNTIHSFCYKLLMEENKRTGKNSDLSVCDEVDQEEILRSLLTSRYPYWLLEEKLEEIGISFSSLDSLEIVQIEGSDRLFYLIEDKLIDFSGEIYPIPENKQFIQPKAFCPVCGEIHPLNGRACAKCGNEFAFSLSKHSFDLLTRRSILRSLISEIKHSREAQGFYTGDEVADNQRAFDYIKENKKEVYEGLVSYYAKYLGFTPDEAFENAMTRFAGRFTAEYDEYLRLSNLVDFDDLIIQTSRYLSEEERLACWSQKYKYIIVDEMQDTSLLEYSVFKKIFGNNRIMLCGDFFQTIYGWRGSNPSLILDDYIQSFSAKIYMFSENYRSTKTLANATFGYLQNTYPALVGKYCPQNLTINSQTEGEKIRCYAFSSPEEEAFAIYKYLQREGEDAGKVCIMARSNKYIAELFDFFERFNEEEKEKQRLCFFTVEENFNFFKKPVIKDLLAVLKLLVNPLDRSSMERLSEKYVKGVGIKSIEKLRNYKDVGLSILSFLDRQTYLYDDPYHHLIEAHAQSSIVVYDTETTGLDLAKDQIVQISAIKIDAEGEIIDTLDIMVEPTIEISPAAYETHGFDLEYIRSHNGMTAVEALQRFSSFVKGSVLVGHNNFSYDKPLVERQLRENELPALDVISEYDTLIIAKQFYTDLPNFKLSSLCQRFQIVNEQAHNALGDITATAKCLVAMLKEKIIPTQAQRSALAVKNRTKFEKIFAFIEEMRQRLKVGEELASHIAERLGLSKRYPTSGDRAAIREVVFTLSQSKENMEEFLKEFLRDAALSSSQMDVIIQKSNKIPIITVHQAKGCEFDTVILAGADDNHFPSYAAKQSGGEEEEKKVFYVAITRAKERLILTRAQYKGKFEMQETPYFWMIPSEYVKVNHAWKNGN